MTDSATHDLPESNVTRAGITGKVPKIRGRGGRRGKAKAVRLSSDRRSHVNALQRRGAISPKAAASHGLAGGKK